MKSAGFSEFARMPPTFAAASSTWAGRSAWKKAITSLCTVRSSCSCVAVTKLR